MWKVFSQKTLYKTRVRFLLTFYFNVKQNQLIAILHFDKVFILDDGVGLTCDGRVVTNAVVYGYARGKSNTCRISLVKIYNKIGYLLYFVTKFSSER